MQNLAKRPSGQDISNFVNNSSFCQEDRLIRVINFNRYTNSMTLEKFFVMRTCFSLLMLVASFCVRDKSVAFYGSTPAHLTVREFLNISLTDSIDFIKWTLTLSGNQYNLGCQYGLARAGTNGFTNEKRVAFSGNLSRNGSYLRLNHAGRSFHIVQINSNLVHLLDKNKTLLVGNGGYSYTLNNLAPIKSGQFGLSAKQTILPAAIAFEGRTPCQELSTLLGLNKSAACDKLKWYIILFSDSVTNRPTHYLKGGTAYRQETMVKGKWEIVTRPNGRIIYKLDPEKQDAATNLLKADDNILLFTDAEGNPLVGNKDFSYTLNRTKVKKL